MAAKRGKTEPERLSAEQAKAFVAALPEPTEREKQRISAARERVRSKPPRLSMKVMSREGLQHNVCPPHNDIVGQGFHARDAFGTSSHDFSDAMIGQLASIVGTDPRTLSERDTNAALAAVDGIGPQDEAEAMLAVQMDREHGSPGQ